MEFFNLLVHITPLFTVLFQCLMVDQCLNQEEATATMSSSIIFMNQLFMYAEEDAGIPKNDVMMFDNCSVYFD
jgi:hypothetical protein